MTIVIGRDCRLTWRGKTMPIDIPTKCQLCDAPGDLGTLLACDFCGRWYCDDCAAVIFENTCERCESPGSDLPPRGLLDPE